MGRHHRAKSFQAIDEGIASGVLSDVVKESNVYLGGASIGKGLKKAANYYMTNHLMKLKPGSHFDLPGAKDLEEQAEKVPLEKSFFVVDIGVVVSQVYQWRKYFPRVEAFMAVKCNPDPVIIKTLAILGCNFDCASANEIRLVQECTADLPQKPEIVFANPCKARSHILEAVCKGVTMVTFDNVAEIEKCAAISKKIKLILRIITDDRGSTCRFSSKFGAPPIKWRPLLAAAKKNGLEVVGVSFHVGSGCRDASKYELALADAKKIFDMAETEFGMKMNIVDIGGGFPGETHSIWNPAVELDDSDNDEVEGKRPEEETADRFMFFNEIAEVVAPAIDRIFPPESGVRIIGEPGRYMVAASHTLCCSVTSCRNNQRDAQFAPEEVDDREAAAQMSEMTREDERALVRGLSLRHNKTESLLDAIQEELADYSKLYAQQQLSMQETDVYNDGIDLYKENYDTAIDLIGPPEESQLKNATHSVEGLNSALVAGATSDEDVDQTGIIAWAAAGEAAVNGLVMQAVADSAPLQDDYSYYINDGVYGAFNNIMFDHAVCRPRVLQQSEKKVTGEKNDEGFKMLKGNDTDDDSSEEPEAAGLYPSTVFGPTCDSIDVIARSVLLPKLEIGDWLYFTNMGAYTSAASSEFNGMERSDKFYVCSVQPEFFESIIAGPDASAEEKKEG